MKLSVSCACWILMYCLIGCCTPVCALCALWPNEVECVTDCPVPPWSMPMSFPDPRAERCAGDSGRPLRCAACVLLLEARGVAARLWVGPAMNNLYNFVLSIFLLC
ncbi:putative UDP-Gal or UDP-GlcNAc-dependent glycosyltransferase [Trypanosoma cruzi]|nr:putative UDP-Gal or UDP-GlcNAc-dependent glycosyltransferase [Trypanosoma cruzi]